MKVLFLTKYGPLAASARQRFLQYLPYLEAHGVQCTVSPLLGDDYLAECLAGRRAPARSVMAALVRRAGALLLAGRHDLTVVHYEALPYLPAALERALLRRPYLCDYDDAIFHIYDQHRSALVRRLLGGKISHLMARSAGVVCGSRYLLDYARARHTRVCWLPTVVDLSLYPVAPPPRPPRPFTIGWIGSPSTAAYLTALAPALAQLASEGPLRLLLIGSGAVCMPGVPVTVRPWVQNREIADLGEMDVGVMPLPDTPWARGKCGFKLIQYMAAFLPVVASPVGANCDIVTAHGPDQNGMLAQGTDEWVAALRRLRDDPLLRLRLGRAGRAAVQARYCLAVSAPRLLDFLRETSARIEHALS
ncbi:MAG: glycosyltransferase family 4 protein [Myxococcales bacterium]|nr:glycosyltransferase family 4 protein [Myxococcota bacterium]MDW8282622.1 glycosyltransferase family 4 protein [Myxococcales bacterium]